MARKNPDYGFARRCKRIVRRICPADEFLRCATLPTLSLHATDGFAPVLQFGAAIAATPITVENAAVARTAAAIRGSLRMSNLLEDFDSSFCRDRS
jgi:hypothetical protein